MFDPGCFKLIFCRMLGANSVSNVLDSSMKEILWFDVTAGKFHRFELPICKSWTLLTFCPY